MTKWGRGPPPHGHGMQTGKTKMSSSNNQYICIPSPDESDHEKCTHYEEQRVCQSKKNAQKRRRKMMVENNFDMID